MSLRFKKLRTEKITQENLSEKLGTSSRTIRNWEQKDGVVPSIKTMSDIANALTVTTFDVYDCFMNDPDFIRVNDFKFHSHPIEEYTAKRNSPNDLFFCILNQHWYGNGIVRYKNHIFAYDHIVLSSANMSDIIDDEIAQYVSYYDGMIILDKNLNMIPIKGNTCKYWEIESLEFHNITIHLSVTEPVLAEMEDDLSKNGFADIYLTIFDYEEKHDNHFFLDPNSFKHLSKEKIIGQYIRDIRHSKKMKQTDVADKLLRILDNKQISKLEKGKSLPTPEQLSLLCSIFHLSEKEILNSYDTEIYSSNSINSTDRTYLVGLNVLFDKISNLTNLIRFTDEFMFIKRVLSSARVLGNIRYVKDDNSELHEKLIQTYNLDGDSIIIVFEDNKMFIIQQDCIDTISAFRLNHNCVYEIYGKAHDKFHTYEFVIEMSLYMY